ncbi:hypothetical protein FQN52_006909 [Onygenales sp. PD_12]|nr:hypothetical protein FQN52_006909 [Onygenales sp. PD_12]
MRPIWVALAVIPGLSIAKISHLSALNACPMPCSSAGNDPAGWTMYSSVERLRSCNQTMLLDFAIHNPLENPKTSVKIFACTADDTANQKRAEITSDSCAASDEIKAAVDMMTSGPGVTGNEQHIIAAAKQLQHYLTNSANCADTFAFGYAENTAVGVYIGSHIQNTGASEAVLQKFIDHVEKNEVSGSAIAQYCGTNANYVLGIVAKTNGELSEVQNIVQRWTSGECVPLRGDNMIKWTDIQLPVTAKESANQLIARAEDDNACDYIKVASGDSCGSLAARCGITGEKFTKYNSQKDLCSSLTPGKVVCCSEGDLPDLAPKPDKDGNCASYLTKSGDSCSKIASESGITTKDLESFNKNTWAWSGCKNLMAASKICLSKGNPPMPAAISNAACGPQVPDTKKPNRDSDLADLNPCKLNACCNIWGQCGITEEFCTPSKSNTGAPGTALPRENGCISNCRTDIVNNDEKVDDEMSVVYFEAWNDDRPCLNMDISNVDKTKANYIHFAFGDITKDFKVDVSKVQVQFDNFVALTGIKRVLSFGGWSFSTELDTFPIFREGVTDANRQSFADEVVKFIQDHNVDGVDFDWEYPGAPDIPGIPPGNEDDGKNYVKFLKMVRDQLPEGKTLSIAAPASYWYLLGFHPIEDFEAVLDYVIYMTYDLHGQWDHGNKWASPPDGNCLRSHVNITETTSSLSMITKAGMPANKVVVGVSSYGRSFKMENKDCTGAMCTFVGPESAATKGRCTETAGYISDAEIYEIIDENPSAKKSYDPGSDSNILIYNETEWVAYMDQNTKNSRKEFYRNLNFRGTSDWAIDLESMITVPPLPELELCEERTYRTLEDVDKDKDKIPDHCMDIYLIQVQFKTLDAALKKYQDLLEDGYDDKFHTYAEYTKDGIVLQIDDYMTKHADDYWDCDKEVHVQCCSDCNNAWACSGGCENCPKGKSGMRRRPTDCPNEIPSNPLKGPDPMYWKLQDEDAFYPDLLNKTGVDKDWIEFGDRIVHASPGCRTPPPACRTYWDDYPRRKDDVTIPNPKEVIASALKNLTEIRDMLEEAALESSLYLFPEIEADVTTATDMPVFMTEFAVKSMEKIREVADEIEEAQRKEMILGFLMGFLMLIPAVGEAVGAIGLGTVGRFLTMLGIAGDAGMAVYDVVEDPKSIIIGLFMALIAGRAQGGGFGRAAEIRRSMSKKELEALGGSFKGRSDLLNTLQQRMCAR